MKFEKGQNLRRSIVASKLVGQQGLNGKENMQIFRRMGIFHIMIMAVTAQPYTFMKTHQIQH